MINLEEIVIETPNNSSFNNLDNMINDNNTFHSGLLIGLLGGLIVLGCLLPLCKIRAVKSNSKSKSTPIQQTATLID